MKNTEKHAQYMCEWYKRANNSEAIKVRIKQRRQNLQNWWNEFKKTTPPCIKCQESDWRCIDYHHVDPTLKETRRGGISQCPNQGWSVNRIISELKKCEPLCINCHRLEHINEPKNKGTKQRKDPPNETELANMSKNRRYYWRNQIKSIDKKTKRVAELTTWLQELKETIGCIHCQENRYPCLDFHHINPAIKKHQVSKMPYGGYSKKVILLEISKCHLLCGNCHRKHHLQESKS